MATDSEVKELLSALLAEVKSNSMNQKKIFAKIKSMEKEIQEIKGEKEIQQIQQESDRIAQEVSNRLRTLTDAEERLYKSIGELQKRNGEVTLKALEEEMQLDYKTVSGYTRRLAKYGLIRRTWDRSRRINKYQIVKIK